jgi:hypothetical protein
MIRFLVWTALARSMDLVAGAKTITKTKVDNLAAFVDVLRRLKVPSRHERPREDEQCALENFRVPSTAQIARLKEFFIVMAGAQTASSNSMRSITGLANALGTLSQFNPPSLAKIERIKALFAALANTPHIRMPPQSLVTWRSWASQRRRPRMVSRACRLA